MKKELVDLYQSLGIATDYPVQRGLKIYDEGTDLVWIDGCDGPYQLNTVAAAAWTQMLRAAVSDGIEVFLVSGFRSYAYQAELVRNKLKAGETVDSALQVVAPPGCSQHHTGCAIDLGTPGSEFLEEDFETTDAFIWLRKQAHRYGFTMPFTHDNPYGFIYEPWHWYYRELN